MKQVSSLVAAAVVMLLAAAPTRLSAQIFSGLGDAGPGDDGVSIGVLYGQMAPQTKFHDGGTFDNSSALGVSLTFWAARYLGFDVSMLRTNHVGLPASDGRSSVVSGRDPRIDTYMVDMIGRFPLVRTGPVTLSPYLSIGGGWKSYEFKWDTKGGPDARGMDLTWAPGVGIEARAGAQHRLGLRGEFKSLHTPMERWGDNLTFQDRVFTGGLFINF